jgi:hypothetical protein
MTHRVSKDFNKEQSYWYKLLEREGFVDTEQGHDSDIAYRYGAGTPQFKQDRGLASYGESHDIDIGKGSFFESAQEYYNQMSCLVANWPQRWLGTKVFRLERKIMSLHAEGLSGCKIYSRLRREGKLIPGVIGSLRSTRRVIERYRAILALLPFDRLEAWDPGHAVEQILKCDPGLNDQIRAVLKRRQVKKNGRL